jgi:hypothetical protein
VIGSGPGALAFPVDAHVHFYRLGRVGPSLDAAAENFARVTGLTSGLVGAVLLVESSGERVFERLIETAEEGGWEFTPVRLESETVIGWKAGRGVVVVCGRQVRCFRGLEVLALGTVRHFPDGEGLEETVDRVRASNALVAVPWGFGKWTGERGRQVRHLLKERAVDSLYVGDSGGRLQCLGVPEIIRDARAAGFRLLPGTDPFPCGGDHRRIGSFGLLAGIEPDPERPWTSLRNWLESLDTSPRAYGRALSPARFIYNQAGIRLYKMTSRRDAA